MAKPEGEIDDGNEGGSGAPERWAIMSLGEGFRAYDSSANYSHSWHCASTLDTLLHIAKQSGFSITLLFNLYFYARWRARNTPAPLDFRRSKFVWELSVGLAEAVGYLQPRHEHDKPVLIPRDVWKHGTLDWTRAELVGSGFSFTYVQVLMPFSSVLVADNSYIMKLVPLLAHFEPTETRRNYLGLAAETIQNDAQEKSQPRMKDGRPTHKDAIIQAFHETKINSAWKNKQLANAVRVRAKEILDQTGDGGLSDSTILRHIGDEWKKIRDGKS